MIAVLCGQDGTIEHEVFVRKQQLALFMADPRPASWAIDDTSPFGEMRPPIEYHWWRNVDPHGFVAEYRRAAR